MTLVVDASVAVKWLLVEKDSETARRLPSVSEELHAPRLLASEVANAVWVRSRRGELNRSRAVALVESIPNMPLRWHQDETVCADATRLALAYGRSVYDSMYLALAQRLGVRMVTADQRFANALAGTDHANLVVPLNKFMGPGQ